ncbi:hypothetical protein CRG98_000576 [Punica granatum]|uniref:Uncharacterized protein n=1 Tax=Punica granatum TaxID=22663 RepID=A0A2I0LED0_PUNGR|nr:hypothetical protein CRG98_000576 [Punica granatum]
MQLWIMQRRLLSQPKILGLLVKGNREQGQEESRERHLPNLKMMTLREDKLKQRHLFRMLHGKIVLMMVMNLMDYRASIQVTMKGLVQALDNLMPLAEKRKWQLSGIPKNNAIACIIQERRRPEEFMDSFYSVESFKASYEHPIATEVMEYGWEI